MARRNTARTPAKRKAFLAALAEGCTVTEAAQAAGFSRRTAYDWRAEDKTFRAAWRDAYEAGTGVLETQAQRRAVKGTRKPVFHMGKRCGYVREYSDTMLMFLLKSRDPERFCDRTRFAKIERRWAKQDAAAGDRGATVPAAEIVELMARFAAEKAATASPA